MKITEISLKRPVTVLIATFALMLFGLIAFSNMPMERMPDVDFPLVTVTTTMTGAAPDIMDNDVTDVLEEKLNTISGINSITSTSYDGRSVIAVEFELEKDIDAAAADVRDKVNLAMSELPDEADAPVVAKFSASDFPVVTMEVTGEAPYSVRSHFADKVVKLRLQTIDGVGNVNTVGLREREIRIWLDPGKLHARGLLLGDVKEAINNKHVELPAGRIETEKREYTLRLQGEYSSLEELATLPVAVCNGAVVRLGDLGTIEDGFEDLRSVAKLNDEPVILLEVLKQRGANEVEIGDRTEQAVRELQNMAPVGISLKIISSSSSFVKASMRGAQGDVLIGVLLCSLVMFLFLHTLSATFVTVVTIPICIIASFFVIRTFGITINNMTMMGISLAVGMVVDATIVVLENIHRHLEAGEKPLLAASSGTSEVGFAILAGSATTIAVFAPIANMEGIMGRIFLAFGITIITTIALSLILSLTLTPFLCSRMLKSVPPGRIGSLLEKGFGKMEDAYRKTLELSVRHRKTVLTTAFGVFALGIFFLTITGTGFMPTEDRGNFTIDFEMPNNFSIQQSMETASKIEKMVRNNPAVDYTLTSLGSGTGEEVYKGTMSVYLFNKSTRAPISQVMSQIREELAVFRDVDYTLGDFGGADMTMTLVGSDTHKIASVADRMVSDLKADGRLVDIKTDLRLSKPRINISINRGLADSMGVDIRKLSEEVQAYFSGTKAGVFKDKGYRYDIRLQAADFLRRTISDIERIPIRNGSGELLSIPDIVAISEGIGAEKIMRYNRQLSLTISANTTGNLSTGEGVTLIREFFKKNAPEDGSVSILVTGSSQRMAESFNSLISAIAMAVILVYMVMAVQFESFIHPLTVMFSLPLMTAGAFGSLLLAGLQLDAMALIGIILLVGIVVNNAILLVDFINQERAAGIDKTTAVLRAGPNRLRPILMTALSTMVGALPVALGLSTGAEIRQPMSVALVGGLFTSTLLTLIVIPTAYLVVDDMRNRAGIIFRFLRRRRRRTTQEPNLGYSGGNR